MADIKDKIAKLLALAESPNEAEAKAALLKARELMAKNKLTPEECQKQKNQKVVKDFTDIQCTAMTNPWAASLSAVIADNYCCRAINRKRKGYKTATIGFIGLAETLISLYGHHHGESDAMQEKGLAIVQYMRRYLDARSERTHMNYSLLATPAEGLSGRFVRMDKKRYGLIPGVTDKDYYTNSFHIPVYYNISAYEKIRKEAPYHALTNAGHISYVELDGDTANNLEAFESIVRCMHDCGIGYGSINHPVDRDPICGYVGVIGEICPRCGRREGEAVSPERIKELRKLYPGTFTYCGCE